MKSKRALVLLAAPAFAFSLSSSASAFEISKSARGAELKFLGRELPYDVDFTLGEPQGELLSAAARRAFDSWGSASKNKLFPKYLGPGHAEWTIALVETWDERDGDKDRTLAAADVMYDTVSGEIFSADVRMNGEKFRFAANDRGAVDPESVLVHELGHAIGFEHTCGVSGRSYPSCFDDVPRELLEAVMAPSLSVGSERRTLGSDDLAALAAHYGASSTVAAPHPLALQGDCSAGAHVLSGEHLPADPRIELRLASGAVERPTTRGLIIDGLGAGRRVDVLVFDRSTGAYGSLVDVEVLDPCAPPLDAGPDAGPIGGEVETGCGCASTGRQSPAGVEMIALMALAAVLSSRARARARKSFLLLSLLALGVASSPGEARAYKCSRVGADFGPSLVWQTRTIPWFANDALTDDIADREVALEQLTLSYRAWEDVDCSDIALPFMGVEAGLKAGFNESGSNQNVVVFIESDWKYDPTVIAVTTNAFDTRSGAILDSDIEVNGAHFRFVVANDGCDRDQGTMDIRNALTHEVGHLLGLDHPPNTPRYRETTMYASAPPCETQKQTLHPDDIGGLCAIYPAGMETEQCYPPNGPSFALVESNDGFGGCSHTSARGGGVYSSIMLLCAASLLAIVQMRRTRARL